MMNGEVNNANWRDLAPCKGQDAEIFFPEGPRKQERIEEVVARFCGACALSDYCFDYARQTKTAYGIYGGVDMSDYRKVLKRLGRKKPSGAANLRRKKAVPEVTEATDIIGI